MTDYRCYAGDGPLTNDVDGALSCALEFHTTSGPLWLKQIAFFRGTTAITGAITGELWTVDGPSSGSPVAGTQRAFSLSGVGWHYVDPDPVPITPSQDYKAIVHFPSNYTATGGYWESGPGLGGVVNGPLVVPDTFSASNGQNSFAGGPTLQYTTGSFHGGNFWVDVILTDVDPAAGNLPIDVGQPSETDTALPLARTKRRTVGQPSGADSVFPVSRSKRRAVGEPSETDSALPLARSKRVTLGVASGQDVAPALGVRLKRRVLGLAQESDAALPMSQGRSVTLGLATENGSALSIGRSRLRRLGQARETDVALPLQQAAFGWPPKVGYGRDIRLADVGTPRQLDLAEIGSPREV